jgi:hypothetical protein
VSPSETQKVGAGAHVRVTTTGLGPGCAANFTIAQYHNFIPPAVFGYLGKGYGANRTITYATFPCYLRKGGNSFTSSFQTLSCLQPESGGRLILPAAAA